MEVLFARCAGLDVHKDTVVAAVRIAGGGRAQGLRMKDAGEDLLHVSIVPRGHFPPALQACL